MADSAKELERLPYRLKEPFITTTELALFRALTEIMSGRYLICPKVALNDIFYIVRPNENVHFFNKFFRKHVDFLLCEPKNLLPVFGVNIVRGVSKTDTRESDKFMDELFMNAGIPLVHIAANEKYDPTEIMNLFQLALMKIGGTGALRVQRNTDSVPQCPTCGKMMVLRIQRDGPRSGKKYYGCIDSPECDGMIPLE